jgi:hypothetical protein
MPSRLNRIAIMPKSLDLSTSGLAVAIQDLSLIYMSKTNENAVMELLHPHLSMLKFHVAFGLVIKFPLCYFRYPYTGVYG